MTTTAGERSDDIRPPSDAVDELAPKGFRTDIQALRAIAVLAVVFNHLWPSRLTGGYVGVDVFFVISGFLITAHLDREIVRTGRIRLTRFYARRIRRLLPAAFLVLLFSMVAAYFLLPFPWWASATREAVASALYWENWLLAAHSVDYSNLTAAPSIEQHYWSLSVEEQFYLCWPLLLLLLFKVRLRWAKITGIGLVGIASLAFSISYSETSRSQAYFVTPVRVWEFAIGALIALGGAKLVVPMILADVAFLAGLVMVLGSAFWFDHQTVFPGANALIPTVGTGLVILAGMRSVKQWHTALLASPPIQFIGNISYSLYLWHWPLIVLAPFALRDELVDSRLTEPMRVGILALAVVLAAASKVLVEDRARTWSPLAGSTRFTFAAMVVGMVAVAGAAGALNWTYDQQVARAERDMRSTGPCHGAAARVPGSGCADPFGPAKVVDMGPANEYWHLPKECGDPVAEFNVDVSPSTWFCDFSTGAPGHRVVWLVGDSHAQQWLGPMVDLARERNWLLKVSFLGRCPFAKIQYRGYQGTWPDNLTQRCMAWTSRMAETIAGDRPDLVFTTFFARQEYADDHTARSQTEQYRDGLTAYWHKWTDAGARVVVLVDPPLNVDVRAPDCVALNPANPTTCAVDRSLAQPPDPLTDVVRTNADPKTSYVDLTDYFCDERTCYAVVGNVAVYFDANHLNIDFSRTLRPMIATALEPGTP